MSITTKGTTRCALGVAAVLFALGSACSDSKEQKGAAAAAPIGATQSTQATPPVDVRQLAQEPLVTNLSESELAQFFSSMPDGRGLPEGSGTVAQGEKIYAAQCQTCHGAKLEGGIGDKLIGGRGSLTPAPDGQQAPVKTLESYWPYATTLWDYIKRAMPFSSPGSLSNDDAYAVTAYLLNQAGIVPDNATMNKDTLPKVEMPNRNGFREAGR
jgi:cytochrome c